jgi:hypothetical protein
MSTTLEHEEATLDEATSDAFEMTPDVWGPPPTRGPEDSRRQWMLLGMALSSTLSVLALIVSLFALAGNGNHTVTTAAATAGGAGAMAGMPGMGASSGSTGVPAQTLTMAFKSDTEHGRKGPDGQWHDAALPAMLTVRAGAHVTVTLYNYDTSPHSFTSPTLGTDTVVPGGSATAPHKATVSFTAPSAPGKYLWYCSQPCDPFAMSHIGYMEGYVTVTS